MLLIKRDKNKPASRGRGQPRSRPPHFRGSSVPGPTCHPSRHPECLRTPRECLGRSHCDVSTWMTGRSPRPAWTAIPPPPPARATPPARPHGLHLTSAHTCPRRLHLTRVHAMSPHARLYPPTPSTPFHAKYTSHPFMSTHAVHAMSLHAHPRPPTLATPFQAAYTCLRRPRRLHLALVHAHPCHPRCPHPCMQPTPSARRSDSCPWEAAGPCASCAGLRRPLLDPGCPRGLLPLLPSGKISVAVFCPGFHGDHSSPEAVFRGEGWVLVVRGLLHPNN